MTLKKLVSRTFVVCLLVSTSAMANEEELLRKIREHIPILNLENKNSPKKKIKRFAKNPIKNLKCSATSLTKDDLLNGVYLFSRVSKKTEMLTSYELRKKINTIGKNLNDIAYTAVELSHDELSELISTLSQYKLTFKLQLVRYIFIRQLLEKMSKEELSSIEPGVLFNIFSNAIPSIVREKTHEYGIKTKWKDTVCETILCPMMLYIPNNGCKLPLFSGNKRFGIFSQTIKPKVEPYTYPFVWFSSLTSPNIKNSPKITYFLGTWLKIFKRDFNVTYKYSLSPIGQEDDEVDNDLSHEDLKKVKNHIFLESKNNFNIYLLNNFLELENQKTGEIYILEILRNDQQKKIEGLYSKYLEDDKQLAALEKS
ncbi:MAG: hypothetical protein JW725_04255 [Candidatus Babeliaceae bacterium]|nr:hypothetical protein [Candidatus Babeliaceae bacterium]